jgi:hypothetical protein
MNGITAKPADAVNVVVDPADPPSAAAAIVCAMAL